jgi:hypothetical protein
MFKATILIVGALAGVACAEQTKEPETPKQPAAGEQQMTPASGDQPIEREYPPPPPPVINDQEPEDEGFDYTTTPPSDNGEYRDDVEAPPP